MDLLPLPSGLVIEDVQRRLDMFLAQEWPYYDALADDTPNRVTPLDVLAPVSVNAYAFSGGAGNLRLIHRGLAAACDPLLPAIPVEARLSDAETDLDALRELLHAAVSVPRVLLPVATKVLFRKRRELVPMLDNIVLSYYFEALGRPELAVRSQDKLRAADVAGVVLEGFGRDLRAVYPRLEDLADRASGQRTPVGPVRVLEVLLWSQVEPRGYYRS